MFNCRLFLDTVTWENRPENSETNAENMVVGRQRFGSPRYQSRQSLEQKQ